MEKLKQMFSPNKKDHKSVADTISEKETEEGPVRPLESSGLFSHGAQASQTTTEQHDSLTGHHHDVTLVPDQKQESRSNADDAGECTDLRELNEQPAKEAMHHKLDEQGKHPWITTTTTTTHTPQKDVTSTATMNPRTETYTTTTTYKKEDT